MRVAVLAFPKTSLVIVVMLSLRGTKRAEASKESLRVPRSLTSMCSAIFIDANCLSSSTNSATQVGCAIFQITFMADQNSDV